ncbi:MAG TPA: MFS transporter, partial [Thermoplasmata archaeon]|nr:MFS transporter [Thermoplasmata archaeon]
MAGDRRVLLVNSLYHLTNDGAVQVLSGQIAILTGVFAFGPFETGILGGTALLVNAIVQVFTGVMSDRRDPSRFLPIGILIVGVASLLVALATSFWALLLFVALLRVGASFYHPVGMSWIGRAYPPEELDRSMGFQSGFGDFGEVLGTATGALFGLAWGWWWAFVIWGIANLLAVAAGLVLVRGHPSPPVAQAPIRWGDLWRSLGDVKFWILPLAIGSVGYNVIALFGPQLLHKVYGVNPGVAGFVIAAWLLVGTGVALSFGRSSRLFGRFRLTVFAYVAIGLTCLATAVLTNPWLIVAVTLTLGAGLFLTYPALFAAASEASHRQLQGAAFGFVFFFQLLGGAIGTYVAGFISDAYAADPILEYT